MCHGPRHSNRRYSYRPHSMAHGLIPPIAILLDGFSEHVLLLGMPHELLPNVLPPLERVTRFAYLAHRVLHQSMHVDCFVADCFVVDYLPVDTELPAECFVLDCCMEIRETDLAVDYFAVNCRMGIREQIFR